MKPRPHLQSPNNPFPRRISGGRRPPFSKGVDPADAENLVRFDSYGLIVLL